MSHVASERTLANQIFRSVGQLLAVLVALVVAALAYAWASLGSVEYHLRPVGKMSLNRQAEELEALNERVGCELWGRPILDSNGWYAQFRFPAEIEDEVTPCLVKASRQKFSIEKATWFETKLHELTR